MENSKLTFYYPNTTHGLTQDNHINVLDDKLSKDLSLFIKNYGFTFTPTDKEVVLCMEAFGEKTFLHAMENEWIEFIK